MMRDGLSNLFEYKKGTSPLDPDSDGDEMLDGWEVDNDLNPTIKDRWHDRDGDFIPNVIEWALNWKPNSADSNRDNISDTAMAGIAVAKIIAVDLVPLCVSLRKRLKTKIRKIKINHAHNPW